MVVIIIGVSGSGKTTVGRLLAARLRCAYSDADEFHPAANIHKMQRGIPLDDADRAPWLAAIRAAVVACLARGETRVFSCSALKESYRRALAHPGEDIVFIHLQVSYDTVMRRLAQRTGHFFDPRLARSQFDALEAPTQAIVVDGELPPLTIVEQVATQLEGARS